jgi:hypothetical protein
VIGGFKPKNSNIVNVGQRRIAKLMQKSQWYVSTRVTTQKRMVGNKAGRKRQANGLCSSVRSVQRKGGGRGRYRRSRRRAWDEVFQMPGRPQSDSSLWHLPEVPTGDGGGADASGGAREVGAGSHA